MTVECVFGDWSFSWLDPPVAAYRPDGWLPLTWKGYQVTEVHPSTPVTDPDAAASIALTAHWGQAHPDLLAAIAGDFVIRQL